MTGDTVTVPRLMTLREIAEQHVLPWSLDHLRGLAKERRLPGLIKLHGTIVVDVERLREWIESSREPCMATRRSFGRRIRA